MGAQERCIRVLPGEPTIWASQGPNPCCRRSRAGPIFRSPKCTPTSGAVSRTRAASKAAGRSFACWRGGSPPMCRWCGDIWGRPGTMSCSSAIPVSSMCSCCGPSPRSSRRTGRVGCVPVALRHRRRPAARRDSAHPLRACAPLRRGASPVARRSEFLLDTAAHASYFENGSSSFPSRAWPHIRRRRIGGL